MQNNTKVIVFVGYSFNVVACHTVMPKTIETLIIARKQKKRTENIIVFVLELEPTSGSHLEVDGKNAKKMKPMSENCADTFVCGETLEFTPKVDRKNMHCTHTCV